MDRNSFAYFVDNRTKNKYEKITVGYNDYYYHPTFSISNLSEYISLVSLMSDASKTLVQGDTIVFRGIKNKDYHLRPGLARIDNLYNDTEGRLINDFLTRRPDAFKDLNAFDIMAKMQHYGLPTRLLDFTTNPLVALYFACESPYSKYSGRVLCHYTFLQNDNSQYVKAICNNAVNRAFDSNYTFEDYFSNENISLIKYLYEFYTDNETTVIRPKYWNNRITNQAGAFMVFPNNLLDKYLGIIMHSEELGIDTAIEQYAKSKIDRNILRSIMSTENTDCYIQLDDWYLSDKYCLQLLGSYKTDDKDLLLRNITNRFIVKESLKALSKEKRTNEFCSIIIQNRHKLKILKELSMVGIGVDYIYPELEYTAQEVKNHYL